jgi:hypothetical protein
MTKVRPINFNTVSFAVQQINEVMLRNGRNEVLCVQVDEKNNIIDVGMIPLADALAGGFEPAKFVGKKK